MSYTVVIVSAAIAALAGAPLTRFAATRLGAQPLEVDVGAERRLLDALTIDVGAWVRCAGVLKAADFTGSRALTYEALHSNYVTSGVTPAEPGTSDEAAEAMVDAARLRTGQDPQSNVDFKTYQRAGETVAALAAGRELTTHRCVVVETGRDEEPLERVVQSPSRVRQVAVSAISGVCAGAGVAAVGAMFDTTAGFAVAAVALLAVICGGVVLSLVDFDSYLIDMKFFTGWVAVTWLCGVAAVLIEGDPSRLYGAFGALGIMVGFEVVVAVWSRLRNITQGGGDTMLALVTCGVPAVLSGRWETAVHSAIAAGVLLIAFFCVQLTRRRITVRTPIAFGPFMCLGAVVAVIWSVTL